MRKSRRALKPAFCWNFTTATEAVNALRFPSLSMGQALSGALFFPADERLPFGERSEKPSGMDEKNAAAFAKLAGLEENTV